MAKKKGIIGEGETTQFPDLQETLSKLVKHRNNFISSKGYMGGHRGTLRTQSRQALRDRAPIEPQNTLDR